MASRSKVEPNGDDDHRQWPHSPAEKRLQHFFKIILPSTIIKKKLRIPTKFVRKFGDELSDAANFIIPNGHLWKVGLRKVRNDIWFDDGWHDFVEYHSICKGYLLVFGYKGFSNFSIFIFDASACEIEYPCNNHGLICGEKFQIQNQVEVEDDNSVNVFGSRIWSPSSSFLKCKVCDASASKEESGKGLVLLEQNPGTKKRSRCLSSTESPNLKQHYETRNKKLKMEQLDELTYVDTNESRKGTLDKHIMSCSYEINEFQERDRSNFESGENQLVPKCEEDLEIITSEMFNSTKFSPESQRAIHVARKYSPKYPSFMVVLSSYNCYCSVLYLPMEFSGRYLIKAPKYIKLKVSDAREWTVCLRKKCRRMELGKGLTAFFRDNNVKPGDVCVFELIKGNAMLKASIFPIVRVDTEIITSAMFEFTEVSPDTKRAIHAARNYNHKNPSFMVVIRAYNCNNNVLYVPKGFSNRYLRRAPKYIKLEVSDGKKWTICLNKNCKKFAFGNGWNEFRRDNNLKAGDVCVFELIANNDMMKASIFHAVEGVGPEN